MTSPRREARRSRAQAPARARGSAIQRGRWEMGQFLHDVPEDELRGLPEATAYDIEPDRPERGWWPDPAGPDLGQRRFHTGTDWSDVVAFVGRTGAPRYYLTTLCAAAVQIARSVPLEWRSFPLWVPCGLAVVAFVVARGFRSVLSALGLG